MLFLTVGYKTPELLLAGHLARYRYYKVDQQLPQEPVGKKLLNNWQQNEADPNNSCSFRNFGQFSSRKFHQRLDYKSS